MTGSESGIGVEAVLMVLPVLTGPIGMRGVVEQAAATRITSVIRAILLAKVGRVTAGQLAGIPGREQ